jgi:hypothetical protein
LLGAGSEIFKAAPGAIASQIPQLGAMWAGAEAGGALGTLVAPGPGTLFGSVVGAAAPLMAQFFGSNIERQAQEQIKSGNPIDISKGNAALAAAGQTGLELVETRLLFGSKFLGKALGMGEKTLAEMPVAAVEKLAQEKLLPSILKGTAKGIVAEIPTEVSQQILERAQAGLPLTSPDALAEYGDTAYQTALVGPLGIVGRRGEIASAKAELSSRNQEGTPTTTPQFVRDEKGNLVPAPPTAPPATPAPTTAPVGQQLDLFGAGELPNQVTPGESTAAQRSQAEVERNIFALQQEEQTPEVKQKIADLQEQLPKGPGETLDSLKEEHDALGRAHTILDEQKAALIQQRNATPKLDDKLSITNQIKAIETQQQQILSSREDLVKQGEKLAKQVEPAEPTLQRKLKEVSPIVGNAMSKFGLTPKAPIRNTIKNLDMTVPEDRATFIDEVNKHAIKGAKINMDEVEKYLSYFEETPNADRTSADNNGVNAGTVEPSLPVPNQGTAPTQGTTAPVSTGVESDIGSPVGVGTGTETLQNVQPNPLETPQATLTETPQATLTETPQATPTETPQATPTETPQATPTETPQTTPTELQQAQELFGNEGGKNTTLLRSGFTANDMGFGKKPKLVPTEEGEVVLSNLKAAGTVEPKAKTGWFTKDTEDADNTLNKSFFDKVKDLAGMGNFWSFDQVYMNTMRNGLLKLGAEGKVVMKDALDALRRVETTQVLYRTQLATESINTGILEYDATTNRHKVVADPINMGAIREQLKTLSSRVGISIDDALAAASKGFEANRIQSVYDKMNRDKAEITRIEKKIQAKEATPQNKEMLKKLKTNVDTYEKQTQHMTRQEAMAGMKLYNGIPEVQEIARMWGVMRNRVVNELVRSGVTSEDKAERWLDEMAYVPFFRTIEEQKAAGMQIYRRGLGESMAEYKFEGSMLPVENTIGNMYQWMQWSLARAISNQHQQVALDQMRAIFPDMVKDGRDSRGHTFNIYRGGVKREYSIANPLVAQYFMGVGSIVFGNKNAVTKGMNLFTKGITLVPGFSATQLVLKDTYEAMHSSGVKNPYGIVINILKEMYKTAMDTSEARKELVSRGQLSTREHAMAASHDADIATKLEVKEAAIHSKIIGVLGKFSALSDNLLRQAVYQQLINEGISKDEAASRATEIFNYRRTSGSTAMQFLNNYVPFMNAFTVSTKVSIDTISGKGITAQTRAQGIAALAQATVLIGMGNLMYMMMVGDSDEYKRMNRYRRDKSYVIPGTGVSIPVREGLFLVDKLAAEYAYNIAMHSDVTDAQMFKDAASRAIVKQFIPPVSPLVTAPLGTALNKDLTNLPDVKDIVNVSQSKELPEYQMNKNTSELAKVIGKEGGISPLKVDYFLKTATGSFMAVMANITNELIANQRGKPLPAKEGANMPLEVLGFGSYLSKPGTPNVVPDLYTAAHEVDKVLPTVMSLVKTDKQAAKELLTSRKQDVISGKEAGAIEKVFAGLNRQEAVIREKTATDRVTNTESKFYGKPYTPEVKKGLIDELDAKRIQMTPKVMAVRKRIYEK